jgi:hypothetical protein
MLSASLTTIFFIIFNVMDGSLILNASPYLAIMSRGGCGIKSYHPGSSCPRGAFTETILPWRCLEGWSKGLVIGFIL